MNKNEMIECSLVKVTPRSNRLSCIFNNSKLGKTPMRTFEIKTGNDKKSLFEVYSETILGYLPDIEQFSPLEISKMFTKMSKGKLFLLRVKPSKCGKYIDIASIRRGSH